MIEGDYRVFDDGPDVVLAVGNSRLTMAPDVARNISGWLTHSGQECRDRFFPDMQMQFHVAQLKDGNAEEAKKQRRRDGTAVFGGN